MFFFALNDTTSQDFHVRHRTFGWVDIEPGLEVEALEPGKVLNNHGIPERVMLGYLQGEIEGETAVKNLPATCSEVCFEPISGFSKFVCSQPVAGQFHPFFCKFWNIQLAEAAILLIVWFLMMNLSHELPETIQSIEKAIDFDITETLS